LQEEKEKEIKAEQDLGRQQEQQRMMIQMLGGIMQNIPRR
jgi:hypothetical protein